MSFRLDTIIYLHKIIKINALNSLKLFNLFILSTKISNIIYNLSIKYESFS